MIALETAPATQAALILPEQIHDARVAAKQSHGRIIDVLEEQSGLPPQEFIAALATTLHYPMLVMDDLHNLSPAFDLLPFTEALERECLVFRGAGGNLSQWWVMHSTQVFWHGWKSALRNPSYGILHTGLMWQPTSPCMRKPCMPWTVHFQQAVGEYPSATTSSNCLSKRSAKTPVL